MSKIKLSIAILLFTVVCTVAEGAILLEPFLGYSTGKVYYQENGSPVERKLKGTTLGARVALLESGLMVGGEMDFGFWKMRTVTAPQVGALKYRSRYYGGFLGFASPVGLRFWGTVYFSAKLVQQEDWPSQGYGKGYTTSGQGIGLGIGYTALPIIAINFQYRYILFSKTEVGSGKRGVTAKDEYGVNIKSKEYCLNVSIPFTLF